MSFDISKIGSVKGWKEVPIAECKNELVPLGPFSPWSRWVMQDSIYFGERISSPYFPQGLKGSLLTPFVRKEVAQMLQNASLRLPERHMLLIWDAYRPLEVQKALFDYYVAKLIGKKGVPEEQAEEEAQRFVSLPSDNPARPSPHNTGGVVDLTIVVFEKDAWKKMKKLNDQLESNDWQTLFMAELERLSLLRNHSALLPMGTLFDEVAPQTATIYYHKKPSLEEEEHMYLKNRQLLFEVMTAAGFSNYEEEWWHWSHGDQMWAAKGRGLQPAIYGSAPFSEKCAMWEDLQLLRFRDSFNFWYYESALIPGIGLPSLSHYVHQIVENTGNPCFTVHPRAHAI